MFVLSLLLRLALPATRCVRPGRTWRCVGASVEVRVCVWASKSRPDPSCCCTAAVPPALRQQPHRASLRTTALRTTQVLGTSRVLVWEFKYTEMFNVMICHPRRSCLIYFSGFWRSVSAKSCKLAWYTTLWCEAHWKWPYFNTVSN